MHQSDPDSDLYLDHIPTIATEDVRGLVAAQRQYGNSWKRRGGIGAFMMLARKWDRIERRVSAGFDVLDHLARDDRAEGLIDDIRDLRRYLILVEAEARAMGIPSAQTKHRDNNEEVRT